jgi:hypothetical protein
MRKFVSIIKVMEKENKIMSNLEQQYGDTIKE